MSEHNGPWEVKSDCNLIYNASGDWIAQFFDNGRIGESCITNTARAVRCVNACAGMSDEDVENVPALANGNRLYREACVKDTEAMTLASIKMCDLQAQLTEARGLLELMTALTKLKYGNLNAGVWQQIKIAEAFLKKEG